MEIARRNLCDPKKRCELKMWPYTRDPEKNDEPVHVIPEELKERVRNLWSEKNNEQIPR